MKSKLKSMFALVAICGLFAFVSNTKVEAKAREVWLGITYVMDRPQRTAPRANGC